MKNAEESPLNEVVKGLIYRLNVNLKTHFLVHVNRTY